MNRSKEACHCRNVTYGMIEDAVKKGARTFEEVRKLTGAAGACGKCGEFVEYLVRELVEEQEKQQ